MLTKDFGIEENVDVDFSYDDVKNHLALLDDTLKSHFSSEDVRLCSTTSDQYNESIDDSLEEQAMLDVFVHNKMYGDEDNTFDGSLQDLDEIFNDDDDEVISTTDFENSHEEASGR